MWMKDRCIRVFVLLVSIFISIGLYGQQDESLINITFDNASIPEAIGQINQSQNTQVYFRDSDIPSKKITESYENTSLTEILDNILNGTLLSYLSYRDYAIVVAPKNIIDEYYTADYYIALKNQNDPPESEIDPNTIISVGDLNLLSATGKANIKGTVVDALNNETVIGATINFPTLNLSTVTDAFGQFEFSIPAGSHEIKVEFIGYEDLIKVIEVKSDGEFELLFSQEAVALQEVLVKADAIDVNIDNAQIGVERLDVKAIKKLPAFMGEADVVKSLLLQPGVSNVGEGAIGFNVRGGQVDQNLVMQDEGFLFNTSHSLGFFSTFNPELISFVTLYKGNIPAEFGGRLASVLDVEMRDGSFRKMQLKGGI